jgi:hypothetical protein
VQFLIIPLSGAFIQKIFDQVAFSPSVGALGAIIFLWNSSIFDGKLLEIHRSVVRIIFTSKHTNESSTLVTVYGPCRGIERDIFVQ